MSKVDFQKELKHLYAPSSKQFTVVDVPAMQFLMVDGQGDPNTSPQYQEALEALYAVAYTLKFASKKAMNRDYVVPPPEGLWWAEDMDVFTSSSDKSSWSWTIMIMQPEWITQEMLQVACDRSAEKKALAALPRLRLVTYHEGLSVQILHIGSYADEAPTLQRLHHEWMPQNGFVPAGKHHEIYLSDPRRTPPEKWRTVLRQPIRRLGDST